MSTNPYVAPGSDALIPVIQGPHSPWPRKRVVSPRTRAAASTTAGVAAAGLFIHCTGPIFF